MKNISIIVLLIVVLGGGYLLLQKDTETDIIQSDTVIEEESISDGSPDENTPQETDTSSNGTSQEIEISDEINSEVEISTDVKEFTVDSFSFGYSMEEIKVNEGDTVTINLTNSGGFHDLVIDDFDASTAAISAGDTASVTFVAGKKGVYEFYCSIGNHRAQGMVGNLIVE